MIGLGKIKSILVFGLPGTLVTAILIFFASCGNSSDVDSPTAGKFKVGVDNSYSLLIDAQLYTFQTLYKYAKIDTLCRNEADVINAFMQDSVQLMVVSRKLTGDEEARLKSIQIYPKTTKVAYDAVAFIVNRDNPDTTFFYDKVKEIFEGKIKTWKDINPKSKLGDLKIIFDSYKSGNTRYFREKFGLKKLPDVCFAVSDNAEVINFVEKNPGAVGVVSVNWVSDKNDTVSHSFLQRVKVVSLSSPGCNDPGCDFYSPHPGYIVEGFYPFTREVFCINRQPYVGLAYGLSSFIAGEKGQLIVLHSGMVPAAMPVRLVEVKR